MKRTLVEYSSSDDESTSMPNGDGRLQPFKKRKLPPVSSSLVLPVPIDNPALHQGRIRTIPHVDGQFAAHVYVSLTLSRRSQLYKIIQDILSDAKEIVPSLHDIWSPQEQHKTPELHISLSRPIFLRAHQREEFKRAVKNIANAQHNFKLSFAMLSELTNDEKTRTFLTMEVGAGFQEIRNLANALSPILRSIRQQEYYDNPKFHASIGWALIHPSSETSGSSSMINASQLELATSGSYTDDIAIPEEFPTISCLPRDLLTTLNQNYSTKLSSSKVGTFNVEKITLKIGKEILNWKLGRS